MRAVETAAMPLPPTIIIIGQSLQDQDTLIEKSSTLIEQSCTVTF